MELETRYIGSPEAELSVEVREGKTLPGVRGYAAVYSSLSTDLGGFVEEIAPGTFATVLARKPDVRLTLNHNRDVILGRSSSGTLALTHTVKGLLIDVPELPNTTAGRDVAELVRRGDLSQMSFAFRNTVDRWEHRIINGQPTPVRTLLDFDLVDVSIVDTPAYQATSVALRCAKDSLKRWCDTEFSRRNSVHHSLLRLLVKMS